MGCDVQERKVHTYVERLPTLQAMQTYTLADSCILQVRRSSLLKRTAVTERD